MHADIPAKNWKCSILHQKWKLFSTSQTCGPWTLLRKLPAKIVAKFSVMKVVSRDTSDNTTRKTSMIVTYVRGNSIQSSCWRTTLDYVIQMLTVTFVIKICWKVHWIVTNKRTRNVFKCETCDNIYTRKNYLEKHTKSCGADIVRVRKKVTGAFNCDACGKIFT